MTTFDERARGYEAKFAHDADLQFKADARRNRLLGQWAAALLGKTGEDANSYTATVVAADLHSAGDDDVVGKLITDLAGKADESTIRAKVAEFRALAREQVANES